MPWFCRPRSREDGRSTRPDFGKRAGTLTSEQGCATTDPMAVPSPIICKNCALMLAQIVYQRHRWFPLVREPLILGMRMLAHFHRIDARRHVVRNPECKGCIRFMKAELEEKSATFRFLNNLLGEHFSNLRNARLTQAEQEAAKRFAREAMAGNDETPE